MGLFTKPQDGPSQGWLAAFTCCWAAVGRDEQVEDIERGQPNAMSGVCLEQPTPLATMPSFATLSESTRTIGKDVGDDDASSRKDAIVLPLSERPPSIKPLDFGDSSFFAKSPQQARQTDSRQRPVVGIPPDLRRVDLPESQRNSLVPLKLGPVILRDVSDVDRPRHSFVETETAARSTESLFDSSERLPHRRSSPNLRCQQSSSSLTAGSPAFTAASNIVSSSRSTAELRRPQPALSTHSSSSSMRSLRRRTMDSAASSALSMTSFDKQWLKRKRSNQSVAKSVYEIDREILELNTIVEERRAEAARSVSPSEHVPAVAPSMPVRARSKTLTDIGSAFSKPVVSHSTTSARLSKPFMPDLFGPEIIDPIVRPATAHATTGTKAKVSGWLSGFLRSPPSSSSFHTPAHEPFYKCNSAALRPTVSTSSLCSLVTDVGSPSLTTASSPASKRHNRTLTSESRTTSVSAGPMMKYNAQRNGKKDETDNWPLVNDDESQVGIAY